MLGLIGLYWEGLEQDTKAVKKSGNESPNAAIAAGMLATDADVKTKIAATKAVLGSPNSKISMEEAKEASKEAAEAQTTLVAAASEAQDDKQATLLNAAAEEVGNINAKVDASIETAEDIAKEREEEEEENKEDANNTEANEQSEQKDEPKTENPTSISPEVLRSMRQKEEDARKKAEEATAAARKGIENNQINPEKVA